MAMLTSFNGCCDGWDTKSAMESIDMRPGNMSLWATSSTEARDSSHVADRPCDDRCGDGSCGDGKSRI